VARDRRRCSALTCGLSCLNALNALFAKLAAVVIVNGEKRKMEELHPRTDKDSSTATVFVSRMRVDPVK